MRDFKRRKNSQQDVELEPWDEAYIARSMKSSAYNLDFSVCYLVLFIFQLYQYTK